jgi:hypothetical protein
MDSLRDSSYSSKIASTNTEKPATSDTYEKSSSLTDGSKRRSEGGMKNTGKRIF